MKNQKVKLSLNPNLATKVLLPGLLIAIVSACGSTTSVKLTREAVTEAYEAQKPMASRCPWLPSRLFKDIVL